MLVWEGPEMETPKDPTSMKAHVWLQMQPWTSSFLLSLSFQTCQMGLIGPSSQGSMKTTERASTEHLTYTLTREEHPKVSPALLPENSIISSFWRPDLA